MKKEKRRELFLGLFLAVMMIGLVLTNAMVIIGEQVNMADNFMSLASKVVIMVIFIRCVPIIYKRFNLSVLYFLYATVVLALINILFEDNAVFYIPQLQTFIITIVPVVLVCLSLKDYSLILDVLIKASYSILVIAIVVFYMSINARNYGFKYSMGFSTSLILPACCLLLDYFRNKRFLALASAITMTLIALSLGSRGALLGIFVYFVIRIFKYNKNNNKNIIIKKTISLFSIFLLLLFATDILLLANQYLLNLNITSRSITMLLDDTGHMGGRAYLWSTILDEFLSNPFIVRGISADYVALNGSYTHNIFLELLYEGGILFGGLFLIVICYSSIATATGAVENDFEELILLFFCSSMPRLLVSGTVWGEVYFWCWFVMSCSCNKGLMIPITPNNTSYKV